MNLWHLIARQWRERPGRMFFSSLSVAIAIAAVLGAMIAQDNVRAGSRELQSLVGGPPAIEIVSASGERFDPATAGALRKIDGVAGFLPIASRATLLRVHGRRLQTIALGIPHATALVDQALPLAAGRHCQALGEAVLSANYADQLQANIGDKLTFITRRGPRSATIVGLAQTQPLSELLPGAGAVLPLESVQQHFELGSTVDRIRVLLESVDDRARVAANLTKQLSSELLAQTPSALAPLADSVLRSTELALQFSGALSLAMAAFIILNTLRMNFGERRREMAVVRLLGATSRQITQLHLVEGVALGGIGALLGIPLGLLLGRGLGTVMQRVLDAPVVTGELPLRAVGGALLLGPIVSGIAAVIPALQAARVTPREAAGNAEPRQPERFPLWAAGGGGAMLALATAMMALVFWNRLPIEAGIPVGLLMLLSFLVVIPAILSPVIRFVARCLSPLAKMEAELAAGQLLERRIRTGLTVGVLVVAVNAFLGLGNSILSNVADVEQWHRRWIAGDVAVVDPAANDLSATAANRAEVREQIRRLPAASVVEMRFLPARVNGAAVTSIVRDFLPNAELPWAIQGADEQSCLANLRAGGVAIGSVLAKKLDVGVGDYLRIEIRGVTRRAPVAAIANDYALGGIVVNLDREAASETFELGPAAMYLLQATSSANAASLKARCIELANERFLTVRSFADMRKELDELVNGIVGALWGLLAVGFVVGAAAVANALAMNVLEQTGELGLLRILGMTQTQIRTLVFCESLLLATLGMVLGTLAGATTAVIIHFCNAPLLGHAVQFQIHLWLLATGSLGCLAVALVAGWSPGARAARLNLPAAIAYE